jgi:hypothetical protein
MEVQAVPREPDRATPAPLDSDKTVVLVFGSPGAEERAEARRELQVAFPRARIVGCSTTGAPSTTAVRFHRIGLRTSSCPLPEGAEARAAIRSFAAELARVQPDEAPPALVLVFVRRKGGVGAGAPDAGELLEVVREALPEGTSLAGGVAGGGEQAWVLGQAEGESDGSGDCAVGIALHGRDLVVHQHVASRPGPERGWGAAVSLAIGRGAEPPGSDARIVVGGLTPFHGLAEAPGYDDAVVTTVHERLALVEDDFDEVETQVTSIPSLLARPRPPPPPPPAPVADPADVSGPIRAARAAADRAAHRSREQAAYPPVERLGFFVAGGWTSSLPAVRDSEQTLLLVRGTPGVARDSRALRQLGRVLARSHTVGWCAPLPDGPAELAFEVQLARFERLAVRACSAQFAPGGDPEETGRRVATQLGEAPGLVAVLGVSATPPHAPSRHQAGLASVLGVVPVQMVHAATPPGEATWAYDGTRIAGAMLVGVGLYREGLPGEAVAALAARIWSGARGQGSDDSPVEAFWRLAHRLDRADVDLPDPLEAASPSGDPRSLGAMQAQGEPDFGAFLAAESARASQSDGAAPAPNRPGPAPVPSSNASATPVPAGSTRVAPARQVAPSAPGGAPSAGDPPTERLDDLVPRASDDVPPPPDDDGDGDRGSGGRDDGDLGSDLDDGADDTAEATAGLPPHDPGEHRLEIAERQRPVAQGLDVRVRVLDGVSVVTLTGPIGATLAAAELAERVGDVVLIDLDGVEGVDADGLAAWQATMAALAERSAAVYLARCSEAVVAEGADLWPPGEGGAGLVSMFAPYRCGGCGAAFSALYDVREPRVLHALGASTVPCPSCSEAAVLDADPERYAPLAARAAVDAPAAVVAIARGLPMREGPDLPPPPLAPSKTGSGASPRVGVPPAAGPALLLVGAVSAVAVMLVVTLFGAAAMLRWALGDADLPEVGVASATVAPTSGSAAPADGAVGVIPPLTAAVGGDELPPAWVETRLQVGEDSVLAVGRGAGVDGATALEQARVDAVLALVQGVAGALQGAPTWAVIEPSMSPPLAPEEAARAVARFESQLFAGGGGATAQVARDRTWSREVGGRVEVAARYALDRAAWDRLVEAYSEVAEFRTVRVGLLFPTMAARLPGDGQLVVLQTDDWDREARVGDVVLSVEGQPVRSVAQFRETAEAAWRRAQQGRSVDLQVLSNGVPHELRFFRKSGSAGKTPSFKGRPLSGPR